MPRRNRVTPSGEVVAVPERGTLMGNRGVLHDAAGRIVRAHPEVRWIACLTDHPGRRRAPMTPGRYTELFFLDEATALAAGHRPCAQCRRPEAERSRAAWAQGGGHDPALSLAELDRLLHGDRWGPPGRMRRSAGAGRRPPRRSHGRPRRRPLVHGGALLPWPGRVRGARPAPLDRRGPDPALGRGGHRRGWPWRTR